MPNTTIKVIASVPKLNPEDIPAVDMRVLCTSLLKFVEEFWSDPKNREGYDEWLKNYKYKDLC
jgi:hypothetical protein